MKRLVPVLVLAALALPAAAQKSKTTSREQCRQIAEHMIKVGEQAVASGGRQERVDKRRILVEIWKRRLAAGEDPCKVYADIGKAATTT